MLSPLGAYLLTSKLEAAEHGDAFTARPDSGNNLQDSMQIEGPRSFSQQQLYELLWAAVGDQVEQVCCQILMRRQHSRLFCSPAQLTPPCCRCLPDCSC
jgi:hypothetical protein